MCVGALLLLCMHCTPRSHMASARSSTGSSVGLRSRRLQVRILSGVLLSDHDLLGGSSVLLPRGAATVREDTAVE